MKAISLLPTVRAFLNHLGSAFLNTVSKVEASGTTSPIYKVHSKRGNGHNHDKNHELTCV